MTRTVFKVLRCTYDATLSHVECYPRNVRSFHVYYTALLWSEVLVGLNALPLLFSLLYALRHWVRVQQIMNNTKHTITIITVSKCHTSWDIISKKPMVPMFLLSLLTLLVPWSIFVVSHIHRWVRSPLWLAVCFRHHCNSCFSIACSAYCNYGM